MMRFFAFIGVCFLFAVILSVVIGVYRGLKQRLKFPKEIEVIEEGVVKCGKRPPRVARQKIEAEEDLTDDPGDPITDLHDDLL